jgi:hypothetical protein
MLRCSEAHASKTITATLDEHYASDRMTSLIETLRHSTDDITGRDASDSNGCH